jgi:hypothetical protein
MGLYLEGRPYQPQKVLIPAVLAWRNLYASTSAAFSLTPSAGAFMIEGENKFDE